jgi:hypothetical protein
MPEVVRRPRATAWERYGGPVVGQDAFGGDAEGGEPGHRAESGPRLAVAALSSSWTSAYRDAGVVIDHGVHVCVARVWGCGDLLLAACPAVAARLSEALGFAHEAPPAPVGNVAELGDVHVQHRARGGSVLVAAHDLAGGAVQVPQRRFRSGSGSGPGARSMARPRSKRGQLDRSQIRLTQPQRHDPLGHRSWVGSWPASSGAGWSGRSWVRPRHSTLRPSSSRSGQVTWNRAAASVICIAVLDDEPSHTLSGARGVRAALAWDMRASRTWSVVTWQFHSNAGGPHSATRSLRSTGHTHLTNVPGRHS